MRMASSRTKRMADAVRREIRRAGCAGRGRGGLSKRTRGGGGCAVESKDEDGGRGRRSSKFGVRRKLYAALPEELDAREWLC